MSSTPSSSLSIRHVPNTLPESKATLNLSPHLYYVGLSLNRGENLQDLWKEQENKDTYSKMPQMNILRSPKYLEQVRNLRIDILSFSHGKTHQRYLSYLENLCRHLGQYLQADVVHLTLVVWYYNKARYEEEIGRSLKHLSHLPLLASVRIVKKHNVRPAIEESCIPTRPSEFKRFCRKALSGLITAPPISQRQPKPFPFLDLPVELRDMILERSELVSTNPIPLPRCPLTSQTNYKSHRQPCCGHCNPTNFITGCYCNDSDIYSSCCACSTPWTSGLFTVNHEMHLQASEILYKHNTFILKSDDAENLIEQLSCLPAKELKWIRKLQIVLETNGFLRSSFNHNSLEVLPPKKELGAAFQAFLEFVKGNLEWERLRIRVKIVKSWPFDGSIKVRRVEECVREMGLEKCCEVGEFEEKLFRY